jgi:hypothetical protein
MLQMLIFVCGVSCVAKAATYSWGDYNTNCNCKTAIVGTLTSADYDQSQAAQDAAWEDFKAAYEGLVDSDRLGNRTYIYNCHALAYTVFCKWLNGDQRTQFHGYSSWCWEAVSNGEIKSSNYHSCFVNNWGKCGPQFYCKNNQYVYGASMPTQQYIRH